MATFPVSRFPVPEIKDMPEDIRNVILAVQEKSGFVPNVFLALAHRPDESCSIARLEAAVEAYVELARRWSEEVAPHGRADLRRSAAC